MNLKRETELMLKEHDKGVDDIVWIGEHDVMGVSGRVYPGYRVSNRHGLNFLDVEYDDGYGGNEIPMNLVVVGSDWWLERNEYDGSEWWEFKTIPQAPQRIVREGKLF